jgi:acyl-coenzyme A thioesterase PaaI-like protein
MRRQAEDTAVLRDNRRCFVCGRENPAGLQADFTVDAESRSIRGRFTPLPVHEGWEGIVHGGIIAALMDEAMIKLSAYLGAPAVSAEITVKFKAPAAPGEALVITARITSENRRLVTAEAKVERGAVVIGEAWGKLLKIR